MILKVNTKRTVKEREDCKLNWRADEIKIKKINPWVGKKAEKNQKRWGATHRKMINLNSNISVIAFVLN